MVAILQTVLKNGAEYGPKQNIMKRLVTFENEILQTVFGPMEHGELHIRINQELRDYTQILTS